MEIRAVSYAVTALRWVIGWTYFSAFWRRLILDNKLDPEGAGYIGEKFNHFLPNALGIKPLIEYLVLHPNALHFSMWSFTIIEAIVGLLLMLGWFTRWMSIGVISLAMGILLGSGWIGTTCLDEWQIGILGVAGGFTLLLAPLDSATLDVCIKRKDNWSISPKIALAGSIFILALTLYTNQVFHGGVWGRLHNKSVRPIVEIADVSLQNDQLNFEVYRIEGADVYGSFLIEVRLQDKDGKVVYQADMEVLSQLGIDQIHNKHVSKVKAGKKSLIIPLGAKAVLSFPLREKMNKGDYNLILTDISGIEWMENVVY